MSDHRDLERDPDTDFRRPAPPPPPAAPTPSRPPHARRTPRIDQSIADARKALADARARRQQNHRKEP